MKRSSIALPAVVLALSLALVVPSSTFSATKDSHARTGSKQAMFNPKTIETVQGKVAGISAPKEGKPGVVRLSLKTDHGTMPVILGPASYVDKENLKVKKGDDISVTGSKVTMHKKAEIMATEIKKGNETLDLRRSDGTPLWSTKATQGK